MRTLTSSKIRRIVREMNEGNVSVYKISKRYNITPRHCRRVYARFSGLQGYEIWLAPCGRKPTPLTENEVNEILAVRAEYPTVGAVFIERILRSKGISLSHNRIHQFLLKNNMSSVEPKKSRSRKYIRYERSESNNLWHTDYHVLRNEALACRQFIAYEDDASRFITGYGQFRRATAYNAISIFRDSVRLCGIPEQLLSDHGVQFCMDVNNNNMFRNFVQKMGTEHILSRVKHPQSNGKMERFWFTLEKLLPHFNNNVDATIAHYNFKRPHMSLESNGRLMSPYEAFVQRGGKINTNVLNKESQEILSRGQ